MLVPGLYYQDNVLTPEDEQVVVQWLDEQIWSHKLRRRTQQYGYEYDYTLSSVRPEPIEPISGPVKIIADWLGAKGLIQPTQCIVNEYTSDQGIGSHTDSSQFGPVITSISLLAPCQMDFIKGNEKVSLTLMPRSLLVLTSEARSSWKHQIPVRKTIPLRDGSTYHKPDDYRRISLTYRTLK